MEQFTTKYHDRNSRSLPQVHFFGQLEQNSNFAMLPTFGMFKYESACPASTWYPHFCLFQLAQKAFSFDWKSFMKYFRPKSKLKWFFSPLFRFSPVEKTNALHEIANPFEFAKCLWEIFWLEFYYYKCCCVSSELQYVNFSERRDFFISRILVENILLGRLWEFRYCLLECKILWNDSKHNSKYRETSKQETFNGKISCDSNVPSDWIRLIRTSNRE